MSVRTLMIVALFVGLGASAHAADLAADSVVLRDGSTLVGSLVELAPRGQTQLVVRKDWAAAHVPELLKRWDLAEAHAAQAAQRQRKDRLEAWRKDRGAGAGKPDPILDWIDRERARLSDPDAWKNAPLRIVKPARADVKTVTRAPKGAGRLLKLAWIANFPKPETMTLDALKGSLAGRGFDVESSAPVSLDALLPLQTEPDRKWLLRRAATEITFDDGLRLLNYQGVVIPEPAPGQALGALDLKGAVASLKQLLGDQTGGDPLVTSLREIAAKGKVGAIVTKLDIAADFTSVSIEMTLWVRQQGDRWGPAGGRSATVRPDDLGPDAGKDLAADPQIATAFQVVESLGFGTIDPAVKQRSLSIGAATRKALGMAKGAAQADLSALVLPVGEAPPPGPKDAAPPPGSPKSD